MAQSTPIQYKVAYEKRRERPFTGEYWDNTEAGVYNCVCCGAELFSSEPNTMLDVVGRAFTRR